MFHAELVNDVFWFIIFKDSYFFRLISDKFDVKYQDRFFTSATTLVIAILKSVSWSFRWLVVLFRQSSLISRSILSRSWSQNAFLFLWGFFFFLKGFLLELCKKFLFVIIELYLCTCMWWCSCFEPSFTIWNFKRIT